MKRKQPSHPRSKKKTLPHLPDGARPARCRIRDKWWTLVMAKTVGGEFWVFPCELFPKGAVIPPYEIYYLQGKGIMHPVKSWDNRNERRRKGQLVFENGRSWTRRIRWLEDGSGGPVKLKFEDGDAYLEIGVQPAFAQTVWDRFKSGQSIEDSVSILGGAKVVLSRKAVRRAP